MKYLINNIIYDSHQGLLYRDNIDDAIKLTTTLNRLLLVLVQNNGEILDRETLLNRVWDEHNQVASDNNLNSSISVLRRHLSSFFEDEIITTIPKVGIKLNAQLQSLSSELNHDTQQEEPVEILLSEHQEALIIEDAPKEKAQTVKKKSYILNNRFIELALVVIIIFCLLYLFKSYFFATRTEYPEVGRIDQCSIRYINSYHKPDMTTISFTDLQNQLTRLNIDCKKPATLFYYNVGIVTNDKNLYDNFLFLSYCPNTPKDSTTVSCENFYVK
ncbi:helix-turn-helix domain-containing protein [Providencia sp. wls1919]|nr:helix-turn-helix domain-containing protein [Providencia sp. wls1919]